MFSFFKPRKLKNIQDSQKGIKFFTSFKPALTLVEIIVSISLFSVITISMIDIFRLIMKAQRDIISTQNVQENTKYFFEVISKEIRMARPNNNICFTGSGNRFLSHGQGTNSKLSFLNYHGECVTYELEHDEGANIGRFKVSRGDREAYLSPLKIDIRQLNFLVTENSGEQAYVTVNLEASTASHESESSKMNIQTTLSSRHYRN